MPNVTMSTARVYKAVLLDTSDHFGIYVNIFISYALSRKSLMECASVIQKGCKKATYA